MTSKTTTLLIESEKLAREYAPNQHVYENATFCEIADLIHAALGRDYEPEHDSSCTRAPKRSA